MSSCFSIAANPKALILPLLLWPTQILGVHELNRVHMKEKRMGYIDYNFAIGAAYVSYAVSSAWDTW